MSTRAAAVAEPVRRHRERTPATDAQAPDLEGWRLAQTLDERDRHHYRLIDPGGRSAGTVERRDLGCVHRHARPLRDRAIAHLILGTGLRYFESASRALGSPLRSR